MKLLLVSLFAISSGLGFGYSIQDKQDKKPTSDAPPMEPIKPGPEHAMLQKACGNWDASMTGTGEPPSKATMTSTAHGPFYTVDRFEGAMGGMKFSGVGVNGYCPLRKQYFTCWTDSLSPTPLVLWGTFDEKTKTTTMTGECMGMSGKLEKTRTVCAFKDNDHMSFEMYGPGPDGKEMQFVRVEYTRRK